MRAYGNPGWGFRGESEQRQHIPAPKLKAEIECPGEPVKISVGDMKYESISEAVRVTGWSELEIRQAQITKKPLKGGIRVKRCL